MVRSFLPNSQCAFPLLCDLLGLLLLASAITTQHRRALSKFQSFFQWRNFLIQSPYSNLRLPSTPNGHLLHRSNTNDSNHWLWVLDNPHILHHIDCVDFTRWQHGHESLPANMQPRERPQARLPPCLCRRQRPPLRERWLRRRGEGI